MNKLLTAEEIIKRKRVMLIAEREAQEHEKHCQLCQYTSTRALCEVREHLDDVAVKARRECSGLH